MGEITIGTQKITRAILEQAEFKLKEFGIQLVQVKTKRLSYVEEDPQKNLSFFQRIPNFSNCLRDIRESSEMSTRASEWKLRSHGFLNRIARIKFFIGLLLIILSFILGKIALPVLAMNPDLCLLIYAISWVVLIVGIAICGKVGWYMAKRLNKKYGNRVIECLKKLKP